MRRVWHRGTRRRSRTADRIVPLACLFCFSLTLSAAPMTFVERLKDLTSLRHSDRDFSDFLVVSVQRQRMYRVQDWIITRSYIISTARLGIGNRSGSLQTPLGLHTICRKLGGDVPIGGILRARRYIGEVATIYTDQTDVAKDDVTTRILWLCGQEPGVNKGDDVDSFQRFIYIHGTPEEGLLGVPASDGCVRMRNTEVVELFDSVKVGLSVLIVE